MKKSINMLNSLQKAPLLAITSAYKTASTNCPSVAAGELPLDLEVRKAVLNCRLRNGKITNEEFEHEADGLIGEWQARYDAVDKGE